ncbi:MAG TPA: tripartite tricarboxylate transporter substrate binding protein [Xanthobacteraceae bacterium]|nr:tripartite tricarboxylate transporter substrate binding protein [Xanthobacteraceae bacterium]
MESTACRRTIAFALAGLALLVGGAAKAADEYPTKPVRVLVPYGAGGVGDLTVRILTQALGDNLKQRFIIENRPGAGGAIAMEAVLSAPADGYTLGEMGNGQSIATSLFTHLPYDVLKDFSPVSVAGSFPVLIAVADASPYRALKDVVEAAQKNPGKLNLGAINPGSTQNLSAHLFKQITGADFTIIPYRTTPDLVTALLRHDVDVGFDYYAGFQANLGDGKLRVIATSGAARDPLLKDVPTAQESGFPQYVVTSWNGVTSRAGTPPEIVKLLNVGINRALAVPELQEKYRGLGIHAEPSTPDEMHERLAHDIARWREVIDKAGIPKQ